MRQKQPVRREREGEVEEETGKTQKPTTEYENER